jgi:hypothetical protein
MSVRTSLCASVLALIYLGGAWAQYPSLDMAAPIEPGAVFLLTKQFYIKSSFNNTVVLERIPQ